MLDLGHDLEAVLGSPFVPATLRDFVRAELERDQNFPLAPARTLVADPDRPDWLRNVDRSEWHYYPALRQFLLTAKGWSGTSLRSLDDSSDRILRQLDPPDKDRFDIRGLVLGFVQSGKTANYTAVIAKAADAGYRLIIVLSGIDNGLRRQTNIRLKRELVGYPDNRLTAVRMPPLGLQWHEFTSTEINGDFQPGFATHAALQGTQPVLLVVKKNGPVLRRLLRWLDEAPEAVRQTLPFLLIDDEADQASVDTRGTYQVEDEPPDPDYEPPSVINSLIRDLLRKFERRAYVAYTATPFANILIPHDTSDPRVGNDLYPKDFIIDLPKPPGYFGAEEFFGRLDAVTGAQEGGLDVIREVADADMVRLEQGEAPASLRTAIIDFILAGAARAQRGEGDEPATMLVHTSQLIVVQGQLARMVQHEFSEVRDAWRYHRAHGMRDELRARWEAEFRPVTRGLHLGRDVPFERIEEHVGPFMEAIPDVREINSATGAVLDYEREPSLKAIAVGGNRLSRGLTLEGLLVSFFIRRSVGYDTLMQMGRWFGFREGYEDLTRIYTTRELESWFADLAFVEHRLREDIQVYESMNLKPHEVGMRIWQHPTMQVTSPLKRRFASATTISQSYSLALEQTFKFPLRRLPDLAVQSEANRLAVRDLAGRLGAATGPQDNKGPIWTGVSVERILEFLTAYRVDDETRSISLPLIRAYIERQRDAGELTTWTVAVRGREARDNALGVADWAVPGGAVSQISRSRVGESESVGVITSPGDEAVGFSDEQKAQMQALIAAAEAAGRVKSENSAAREVRPAAEGLLLLYPISRHSGHDLNNGGNRRPLYDDVRHPQARDLVGVAISFPKSNQPQLLEAYLQGTVGWRPVE